MKQSNQQSQQDDCSSYQIQLQIFNEDQQQSLKDMNQKLDESCWSDSQNKDSFRIQSSQGIVSRLDHDYQNIALQSLEEKKIIVKNQSQQSNIMTNQKSIAELTSSQKDLCDESLRIKLQTINFETPNQHSQTNIKLDINQLGYLQPVSLAQMSQVNQNSAISKKRELQRMRTTIYNDKSLLFLSQKNMFIQKIKRKVMYFYHNYTMNGRSHVLNSKIRETINDLSDYSQSLNDYRFYNFIISCIYYFRIFSVPILDSESYLGFAVKAVFSILNCLYLYYYSLIITFNGSQLYQSLTFLIFQASWVIEILIKLNTSTYKKQTIIKERKKIVAIYIKSKALFDIIPFIIVSSYNFNIPGKVSLDLLVFLKILNVITDMKDIQRQLCMMMKRYYIIQLINLIFKLFLIAHIIACLWYLLAVYEINYLQIYSWTEESIGGDGTWWKLYISALYWSLTLMTAGSNTATTVLQTFYTTFIMLFTTIAFGYLLNVIGIILSEIDEKDDIQRKDLNSINEYMREKKISKLLQSKVNLNLQYYFLKNYKNTQEKNEQILEKISVELKNQLLLEQNNQIINKISILQEKFSQESLNELCLYVREEFYFPNQIILDYNEADNHNLYYIISGQVEAINNSQTFQKINKNSHFHNYTNIGETFGVVEFFTGISANVIIKSTEFTQVLKIDRQKFLEIIKLKEHDFQVFCQIKDKILLYNQYSQIGIHCSICQQSTHQTETCQLVHLSKSFIYMAQGYSQALQQQRNQKARKDGKKKKTFGKANQSSFSQNYLQSFSYDDEEEDEEQEEANFSRIDQSQIQISDKHDMVLSDNRISKIPQSNFSNKLIQDQDQYMSSVNVIIDDRNIRTIKTSQLSIHEPSSLKKELNEYQINSPLEISQNKISSQVQQSGELENEESSMNIIKSPLQIRKRQNSDMVLKQKLRNRIQNDDLKSLLIQTNRNLSTIRSTILQDQGIINNVDEEFDFIYQYNPWLFDTVKDYKYYFPYGNSNIILKKLQKFKKKQKYKRNVWKSNDINKSYYKLKVV